jgi:FkbM family methyltransferase
LKKATKHSTKLGKYTVHFANPEEYHLVKREIFAFDAYAVDLESDQPVIIDVGAHIGLASLYFLHNYPLAQITAIEPHPENFKLLEQNIWENRLENQVAVKNVGLSDQSQPEGTLHSDTQFAWWSTASLHAGAWTGNQNTKELSVQLITLNDLVSQPVDLLKLDIEGAEQRVLMAATEALKFVKHLVFEFHTHEEQSLEELVKFLEEQNFKVVLFKRGREVKLDDAGGLVIVKAHHH